MKKISLWLLMLVFTVSLASAQESATQQQIDKLSGQIQDLLEAQARDSKRLDVMAKEISELREKVNAPKQEEDKASAADLKNLAETVKEIDRKRASDRKLILEEIANLAKVAAGATPKSRPTPKPADDTTTPPTPQNGYYYEIKPGDTLPAIAKAYRDQGVKVTTAQIKAANPKMNPDVLIVGKKVFIPDANAK
jgi:LysM repeat protein